MGPRMSSGDYDVIVIGGGPGGYVAAIRAAQLGMRTAVVERAHLGGICLNWGCIPTKALLRSGEIFHEVGAAARFGVVVPGKPTIDLEAMVERSRKVSAELNAGVGFLLKKNGVDVIWGAAKLKGSGVIEVTKPEPAGRTNPDPPKDARGPGRYTAPHIIIATGARPRALPGLEPDGDRIWTYFEAMLPPALPKSLLVVGSGAIGRQPTLQSSSRHMPSISSGSKCGRSEKGPDVVRNVFISSACYQVSGPSCSRVQGDLQR